ncbi:MAG TPA: hypothetical protein VGN72_14555 [Tepidisphaeraceae bacterium]|jgi:hypothetical protein|nr:hypothetical protein [Tepidisphaeraceae bacterium]
MNTTLEQFNHWMALTLITAHMVRGTVTESEEEEATLAMAVLQSTSNIYRGMIGNRGPQTVMSDADWRCLFESTIREAAKIANVELEVIGSV